MRKPLVIISQDEFFTQLEKELKEGQKVVQEEQLFCERRIKSSVEKNIRSVWKKGAEELYRRGLIDSPDVGGEGEPGLFVDDGVVFLVDKKGMANPLQNILGGLFNNKD